MSERTADLEASEVLAAERYGCGECRDSALGICPWHAGYEAGIRAKSIEVSAAARPAVGEGLRTEIAKLREFLTLTPHGTVGPDKVPWFIHCGISHGDDRPDCAVCAALAADSQGA